MTDPAAETPVVFGELRRLGLLGAGRSPADHAALRAALCEAFGGDEWRSLSEPVLIDRLRAARPLRGVPGQHRPRYAALSHGGVLECVIALGFDDAADGGGETDRPGRAGMGDAAGRVAWLSAALGGRGYTEGPATAAPLLARRGRRLDDDGNGVWHSRDKALVYRSPLGGTRAAAVVVRILANLDGRHGEAVAASLLAALHSASLCVYAGHARHGLGPDFEPALALGVLADAPLPRDPHDLARRAAGEARRRGKRMEEILDEWLAAGWIRIGRSPASRVVLGDRNFHPGKPTARLVHWLAAPGAGGRSSPAVGPAGLLANPEPSVPHRMWFLQCCRSSRLFPAIRKTPGLTSAALRLVGFQDDTGEADLRKLPWLLDAMSAGQTWEEIQRALADGGGAAARRRMLVDGLEDDPIIP